MKDPDDFPAKGTWSVNQTISARLYFITESHGDGTNTIVCLDPQALDGLESPPEFKAKMEQICARHNEGIRED